MVLFCTFEPITIKLRKMNKLNLIGILIFCLAATTGWSQKTFSEGSVKFEITDLSSDNPQVAGQLEMMKGSTMTIYVKGDQQLTSMNMMNGMMQQNMIMDKENNSMLMLMDMMGRKIKVEMPVDENEAEDVDVDIEYFEDDTKTDGQDVKVETYITDAFEFDGQMIRNAPGSKQLRGMPLEFTVSQPEISMTFTAQEVLMEVDDSVFDIDASGYEEMAPEDLQNMGGMGF
jgi:hypothetical protein